MERPAAEPTFLRSVRARARIAVRLVVPILAAVAAVVALPASHASTARAAGAGLTIHATDFVFQTNGDTTSTGPVHVQFFNDSKDYDHEVFIFPADQSKLDEFLAAKRAGKEVSEADYLTGIAGHVEDVPAGQSIAFDATLPAGTYVLACFVSSSIGGQDMVHYDLGMHSGIVAGASVAPAPTAVAAAPTAAPAQVVKAPNAGAGPEQRGTEWTWLLALGALGALVVAVAVGGIGRARAR